MSDKKEGFLKKMFAPKKKACCEVKIEEVGPENPGPDCCCNNDDKQKTEDKGCCK